uniref:GATA-type domain-containing protein n=1 Tax=Meloidogyne enterolobii TaxID=390850 RepID=A0A6V7USZ5_MELEN|nr:unnamed protein product [Meloidogyne enterolobii]
MEYYKNKLLSSYWTEINLIGYKIELLEKQKLEYPKKLEREIIYIGNKISEINDSKQRHCFNCEDTKSKGWFRYIKEHFLCNACHQYKKRNNGKNRTNQLWLKIEKHNRQCYICGVTQTKFWRRHSELGRYLCNPCGQTQRGYYLKRRANKNSEGIE